MNGNLSEKAMTVRLSISQWTARKLDKAVTAKVHSDYNAASDSGRYNKLLVAQESIKAIQKIAGEARTFHYAQTLPWDDSDARLLPAENYLNYSAKMREYRGAFDKAVSEFIGAYPTLVDDAKVRLNGMFNQTDYPNEFEIARRYAFNVDVSPLATSNDFRVNLQAEEIQQIRAEIEIRLHAAQARASRELWERLFETVKHMAEKLNEPDAIFRDSTVANLVELCELLPRLNVLGDTNLEAMRKDVESKLCGIDPNTLRKDKATRIQAATEASNIMAAMSGYLGAK